MIRGVLMKPLLRSWREKAEAGDAESQFALGCWYADGQGVPRDTSEAMKWWFRASEQGHVRARVNIGSMYANGEGVTRDLVQAFLWFNLACAQNDDMALKHRDALAKRMPPGQLMWAEFLSHEWKPVEPHEPHAVRVPSDLDEDVIDGDFEELPDDNKS